MVCIKALVECIVASSAHFNKNNLNCMLARLQQLLCCSCVSQLLLQVKVFVLVEGTIVVLTVAYQSLRNSEKQREPDVKFVP